MKLRYLRFSLNARFLLRMLLKPRCHPERSEGSLPRGEILRYAQDDSEAWDDQRGWDDKKFT
jgi:hypothetical protein